MSKTNNFVFWGLHIIAWVIFVGLSIEAGALIVNFLFSVFKPEMVGRLYEKLDLSATYAESKPVFYGIYSFIVSIVVLKATLFYKVIQLLMKLDLDKPFSEFVSKKISDIAYFTLSIGFISYVARDVFRSVEHYGHEADKLYRFIEDREAFIIMGAVVYIIAAIFKKGVKLQEENELTV